MWARPFLPTFGLLDRGNERLCHQAMRLAARVPVASEAIAFSVLCLELEVFDARVARSVLCEHRAPHVTARARQRVHLRFVGEHRPHGAENMRGASTFARALDEAAVRRDERGLARIAVREIVGP